MYDTSALTPVDPTSREWALAQLRVILRDTTTPLVFEDAELTNALDLHAFEVDDETYYRPHVAAAALIRSDPERAITQGIDNSSDTFPDPGVIAGRILRSYRVLDDRIEALTGQRPLSASTRARVVF